MQHISQLIRQTVAPTQPPTQKTGTPPDTMSICPTCRGLGFVTYDAEPGDHRFSRLIPCRCTRRRLAQENIERLGLNKGLYARMTFDNYQPQTASQQKALDVARELVTAWGNGATDGLILYSNLQNVGVGKTHLAIAMLKAAADHGLIGYYVSFVGLLQSLVATFQGNDENYEDIIKPVLVADVLALDDLGAETVMNGKVSSHTARVLFRILDERQAIGRTIITTNLTASEMRSTYDERSFSRLHGLNCKTVILQGPDYRMKKP